MITPLIKPAELILLSTYLHNLQAYVTGGEKDRNFYKLWISQFDSITEAFSRLDRYLKGRDAEAAQQVEWSMRTSVQTNEYTIYFKHMDYYLIGIKTYQQEVENDLIQNGLLDKPVQEMTGFEFKTLLLATLKECEARKSQ